LTPVILFDGVCNLCNGFVQFVIARDRGGYFRFGPLQSAAAQRLIDAAGGSRSLPDSMVLVADGRLWTRSSAALRIARRLSFPWPLLYALVVVPRPVRDWIYNIVASNRYDWFGRRDVCMTPTAELRGRFIETRE
jgi:predicted DCC family thiol-disulfide oxidoreductase YuxK